MEELQLPRDMRVGRLLMVVDPKRLNMWSTQYVSTGEARPIERPQPSYCSPEIIDQNLLTKSGAPFMASH